MPGLPDLVVIGAMKCGTTALHGLLDRHPSIAMAAAKELNFFVGPASGGGDWHAGNWHRGLRWYQAQFDGGAEVRGEASPGYTSPSHPEAPARLAAVVPRARLVYLVRDPVDRAVSQYRHHVRDGTERRPAREALLDPASQYVARSRYAERVAPFLSYFAPERVLVVLQEELRTRPAVTLASIFRFAGVDDGVDVAPPPAPAAPHERLDPPLEADLTRLVADDVAALRRLLDRDLPEWRPYDG